MVLSDDINTNLAHCFMMQNRLVDAERLYELTLKNLSQSLRSSKSSYLCQSMAFAQFKHHRYSDAVQSLLRAAHLQPSNLRDWYNIALVSEISSNNAISNATGKAVTAADIVQAMEELTFARTIFGHLGRINMNQKLLNYEKKSALSHEAVCQVLHGCLSSHTTSSIYM
jgi:tetratricopeptide (TPR) repeat protein